MLRSLIIPVLKPELVPKELAEVYSGIFMFTVVSWLTAWRHGL